MIKFAEYFYATLSENNIALQQLVDADQNLRNKFAIEIREHGWSEKLVADFIKKYKTSADDVFDSKRT